MFTVCFLLNFFGSICATTTSGHRAASILQNKTKWPHFFPFCNRWLYVPQMSLKYRACGNLQGGKNTAHTANSYRRLDLRVTIGYSHSPHDCWCPHPKPADIPACPGCGNASRSAASGAPRCRCGEPSTGPPSAFRRNTLGSLPRHTPPSAARSGPAQSRQVPSRWRDGIPGALGKRLWRLRLAG